MSSVSFMALCRGTSITRLKRPISIGIKYLQPRRFFTDYTSNPLNKVQIFQSSSSDPYVNLSIEHHLLQCSHPDSTLLFLYRSRPCVVIGRNQNPWLEANLSRLRAGIPGDQGQDAGAVSLVRRRSGGGAVFHDAGNANWSVICPSAAFDRDRHAHMVVRALQGLGVKGVRVNSRHDIVQDIGDESLREGQDERTFKVSGSAYKLTRLRSLHHGTCLLSSPNLDRISPLLRSPASPYIKARGVESVRSKIRNVGVGYDDFVTAVLAEFQGMYGEAESGTITVSADALEIPGVRKGVDELQSPEWIYGQTPQFTFSTFPSETDPRPRPEPPNEIPEVFRASFTVRHGLIQDALISGLKYADNPDALSQDQAVSDALVGRSLYQINDWNEALERASAVTVDSEDVGRWLNGLFGVDGAQE